MIRDHNRKQEQLEKERKLQRQAEVEQAQKRTVLLRNRSHTGMQKSHANPLSEKSKSKSKDRVRTSQKQIQPTCLKPLYPAKSDFQSLPQLSNTTKSYSRAGLPLPVLKNQMTAKPGLKKMRTTKNSDRLSPTKFGSMVMRPVMKPPTTANASMIDQKKRLTLMKKSHSLSKSFKLSRPLEIINEATRVSDQSLIKVKIPKPRPPA